MRMTSAPKNDDDGQQNDPNGFDDASRARTTGMQRRRAPIGSMADKASSQHDEPGQASPSIEKHRASEGILSGIRLTRFESHDRSRQISRRFP